MELIINNDTVLDQGFNNILALYRVKALVQAIRDLDAHYTYMQSVVGEPVFNSQWARSEGRLVTNSGRPVGTTFDYIKNCKLSERRALLTRICTEAEVEKAIELARK